MGTTPNNTYSPGKTLRKAVGVLVPVLCAIVLDRTIASDTVPSWPFYAIAMILYGCWTCIRNCIKNKWRGADFNIDVLAYKIIIAMSPLLAGLGVEFACPSSLEDFQRNAIYFGLAFVVSCYRAGENVVKNWRNET